MIKVIADFAAPVITICSGLLGLFKETHKEVEKKVKGRTLTVKVLTKWAWVSMIGIIIGGTVSILSMINDRKIESINKCIADKEKVRFEREKFVQDSTYKANTDTLIYKSDRLASNLIQSISIVKQISDTSKQTLKLLVKTSNKQSLALLKQDSLNVKTEQMLNPFLPFKIQLTFRFKRDSSLTDATKGFYPIAATCRAFEETFLVKDEKGNIKIENAKKGLGVEVFNKPGHEKTPMWVFVDNRFQGYMPLKAKSISFVLDVNNSKGANLFGALFPSKNDDNQLVNYQLIYDVENKEYNVSFVMDDFYLDDKDGEIRSTNDFKKYTTEIILTVNGGLPQHCRFQSCLIKFPPLFSKFFTAHFVENKGKLFLNSNMISARFVFSGKKEYYEMPYSLLD